MGDNEDMPHLSNPQQPTVDLERVGFLTRRSDNRDYSLGFGCVRVGRQRRSDIALNDKTVSRHHADICYESGRYVLYDHSSNGTWVNANLVVVAQPLREGDDVRFGGLDFQFTLKTVPRQEAMRAVQQEFDTTLGRRRTAVMKGGKGGRRRSDIRRRLLLLAVVLLLAAASAAAYFLAFGR